MNKDVIKSSIYGFVIGDAMGVPVEVVSREKLLKHPVTKMIGYGSHDVPEGYWSDDTSMVLAIMDSIAESKGINYNNMTDKFCDCINNAKHTSTDELFDLGIPAKKALLK
ncbi:MAG: ADP-ribosylglycohydrolase family protein [Tenericutes bacterium]|nr:ADP-ribosylglycohydrolase family protein [Mycoplasmatota bacterium]